MVISVKILFFAKAREIVGTKTAFLELNSPKTTYLHLLNKITDQFSLKEIQQSVILSLNEEYCKPEDDLILKPGDEIAVIPPLSGG